ncbi:hypothetical protein Tco_1016664 [Tanacetum coccineum]|uniref:Uncharacterized protein n=1 Tax=Tanacetum coccineum TaxID=301880 RepID=A0ABQ5FPW7_9ASTR
MRAAAVGYRIFSARSSIWSSIRRTQRKPLCEMEKDLQYAWYLLSSHSRQRHFGTYMFNNTSVAGLALFLQAYEENLQSMLAVDGKGIPSTYQLISIPSDEYVFK